VNQLVSKEEIDRVAKLMRIEIDDHVVHIDRVQKMIEKAGLESEELIVQEQKFEDLREDKHIPYNEKLIDKLKNYKNSYVRAPKMV